MEFDLEQLGPYGFQDLAAALSIAVCGPHIQVLGPGRDGGRDMYTRSPIIWKTDTDTSGEVWEGYTVFQAKHKLQLDSEPRRNAEWLWGRVREELELWADPGGNRGDVPNYLVIITNVALTPTPKTGGEAMLHNNIAAFLRSFDDASRDLGDENARRRLAKKARMGRIRAWRIWDANQLTAYLRVQDGVRRAFKAFLTVPDVFAHLAQFTDKLPLDELGPGLHRHARSALIGDRSIYFDDAGSGDPTGTPIDQIAIDLPLAPDADGTKRTLLGYVLDRGEKVLRPSLGLGNSPRHIVVAGSPGNGKTTMSKFLVQVYRAALLEGGSDLGADHLAVVDATKATLKHLGRPGLPKHRRWSMRIDLAEYAKEEGLTEDSTLLHWIARKISKRSNAGVVSPGALDSWMRQWPWFLVLDGLDEVTEPHTRKRLIRQVTEFVSDAEGDNCDGLLVLTTRPMGYVENIAPQQFRRVDLGRLTTPQAVAYGIRATRVRLRHDEDKIERISKELGRASENEALRNLMQTPLQVLIMTIIVEGAGRLSPDRYRLFWGYYDTVFRRELSKSTPFAPLLQNYGAHILTLHQRVGFELQTASETSEGATATISRERLQEIARDVLTRVGFEPVTADASLLHSIVLAATHRLVLLAPHGDEGLGFDVRSLQELMAARYLATGTPDKVVGRLRTAAPSPHWRNVWLFVAGQWFADPQTHTQEMLVELVEHIDQNAAHRLGSICPIGPSLAMDLVDDGMARAHPRFFDRLLNCCLASLLMATPNDPLAVARALVRAADVSDRSRGLVADGLRTALCCNAVARRTAIAVQSKLVGAAEEAGVSARAAGLSAIRGRKVRPGPEDERELGWKNYAHAISELLPDDVVQAKLLAAADSAIREFARGEKDVDASLIEKALDDVDVATIIDMASQSVAATEPLLVGRLRDEVLPTIYRAPVGEMLRDAIDFAPPR